MDEQPKSTPPHADDRGPSSLVMLVTAVVLVVGGYFLAIKLKEMVQMQDCVMSGRTNCAVIAAPSR